ncbi:MAG: hypothetical protein JWM54_2357, partial [Acidobacteriaceae bacterium]|nr:hypothetical protein [Acidobacteriaceae bacterium]
MQFFVRDARSPGDLGGTIGAQPFF